MKVKIISAIHPQLLEEEVNKWLEEVNPIIQSQSITAHPMNDRFHDGNIANQWVDYIFIANHSVESANPIPCASV